MEVIEKGSDYCCVFCCRIFSRNVGNVNFISSTMKLETQEQFLRLLKRYLQKNNGEDCTKWVNLFSVAMKTNENMGSIIAPCTDCSGIMKSICEYYREIKVLEMKLEWRLQTLTSIVKSSEKIKFRQRLFQEKLEGLDHGTETGGMDIMKDLKSFREELVNKCTEKLRGSYPKVGLRRYDSSWEQSIRARVRPHDGNDGVIKSIKIPRLTELIGLDSMDNSILIVNELGEEVEVETTESKPTTIKEDVTVTAKENQVMSESEMNSVTLEDDHCPDMERASETIEINEKSEFINDCGDSSFHNDGHDFSELDPLIETTDVKIANSIDSKTELALLKKENENVQPQPTIANFCKKEGIDQPSAENSGANEGRRLSLRQRYHCTRCSKTFSSSEKFREHKEACKNASIDEETEGSQSSDDGDDDNFDDDNIDIDTVSDEDDDVKPSSELALKMYKKRGPKSKRKTYDFMKTTFRCPESNCKSYFYNQTDLDNHSKLHGNFKCSTCATTLSYAPRLALHELRHKSSLRKGKSIPCPHPKCLFKVDKLRTFLAHFLQFHLKLRQSSHTCPVCRKEVDADDVKCSDGRMKYGSWRISGHFKINHDMYLMNKSQSSSSLSSVFRCDVINCPAYFLKESQLVTHKFIIHKNEHTKYECKKCNDSFRTEYALKLHREVHEDHPMIICGFQGCERKFKKEKTRKIHVARDHNQNLKPSNICTFCNETFLLRDDLLFHQNQVHGKIQLQLEVVPNQSSSSSLENFKCPVETCPEEFDSQERLECHSLLHGNFKCNFCDETKSYAPDLALHELSHRNANRVVTLGRRPRKPRLDRFTCNRCDFNMARSELQYVQHHLQTHLKLEMMVQNRCAICKLALGKSDYDYARRFAQHYKKHHELDISNSGIEYHCEEEKCEGAYFLNEDQLNYHNAILHNTFGRKYSCTKCKKSFQRRWELRKHRMKCDRSILKIPCSFQGCQSRFENGHSMRIHMRGWHSEKIKEEVCPQCGKTFMGLNGLVSHARFAHPTVKKPVTKKRVYICSKCGKSFPSSGGLSQHNQVVHVGPEGWKHECSECGKKLRTMQKLEEHQRTHAKEKPFKCEKCGLSYAHRHNYRHHLKKKHGIVLETPKRIMKGKSKE